MKRRPPEYDPDDGDSSDSRPEPAPGADKLNQRITVIFGNIILGAILITIIALVLGK